MWLGFLLELGERSLVRVVRLGAQATRQNQGYLRSLSAWRTTALNSA
jgi:hypothetical protein